MQVNSIGNLTAALRTDNGNDPVKLEVMRKSLSIQKQHAKDMLATLPKPASNPPNLGQSIDIHV